MFCLSNFKLVKEVQFSKEPILEIKVSTDDESALLFYENKVIWIRKFEVVKAFDRFCLAEFYEEHLILSDKALI
jgi:hypothetical protein